MANSSGATALHTACAGGHAECVAELIQAGARVDATSSDGTRPVHAAARALTADALRVLVAAGAPIRVRDKGGSTALHHAASAGSVPCVRFLVAEFASRGLDLEPKDLRGNTPVHEAAAAGRLDVLRVLATTGNMNLQAMNAQGECPADLAERTGHHDCALYLDAKVEERIASKKDAVVPT